MNKVFLSGTVQKEPNFVYTPRGEKLVLFPLWVRDGAFTIEVVFRERQERGKSPPPWTGMVLVAGRLEKVAGKTHDRLRLMADKITRMEE